MKRKVYALILSGGTGERLNWHLPKQFVRIGGKMVIEHTLERFERIKEIDEIIIVANKRFRHILETTIAHNRYRKVKRIVNGGSCRRESSHIGLHQIKEEDAKVIIHDAVRPFVSERIIRECILALDTHKAVDVAIPATDTIIKVNKSKTIDAIPPRKVIMRGQTPQAFNAGLIKKAHALALKDPGVEVTDDCALILKYHLDKVYVVIGDEENIKITSPLDVSLAERIFQLKSEAITNEIPLSNLKGMVVVVLGGNSGIGKAVSLLARKYGAHVFKFSKRNGVNVSCFDSITRILKKIYSEHKRIDHIILTAGVLRKGFIESRKMKDIIQEIRVNYIGAINVAKAGIGYLKESRGSLVFLGSSSYTRGRASYSIYTSTKAAIVNLVQGISEECIDSGVRVNIINPQRTDTPMRRRGFGKEPREDLLSAKQVAHTCLKALLAEFTGAVIDVKKNN